MGIAFDKLTQDHRELIARGIVKVTGEDRNKGELHGLCPIHGDRHRSFSYNYRSDQFNCFSCGAAGDLVQLWCQVHGKAERKKGFKEFCHQYGIETSRSKMIPTSGASPINDGRSDDLGLVFSRMPTFQGNDLWLKQLYQTQAWSEEIIQKLDLWLQTVFRQNETGAVTKVRRPDRVAIPIKDRTGKIRNIRLHKPAATSTKILSWGRGFGKSRLFPATPDHGTVLLCEGEQDTICAISKGFNAITQTTKLKNWTKEQISVFRGRDVVLAYHADQAGERYAGYAAHNLAAVAKRVRFLKWPDYMGRQGDGNWPKSRGDDLTDFFVKHKMTVADLQQLINDAQLYQREAIDVDFFTIGRSGRTAFKPSRLGDRILKEIDLITDASSGLIYKWNGRYWELYDEKYIEKKCIELLGEEYQKNRVKDATFYIKTNAVIPDDRMLNDQVDFICLNNCMLNLKSFKVRSHAKDFLSTVFLDITFDPKKTRKCELWLKYLDETIQTPAAIDQAQEFAGYSITRDTRFGKCLFLLGPGADGKSVFIKILQKLVGEVNCSAVSFDDLQDQFLRASLYGKLLNISTEVSSKALESPYFKAIISGDPIGGAFKHKNSFEFSPYCKLVFAGNKFPRVLDNSDGFFRRILPISFKRQFLEDNPATDPDLEVKLISELSGIFEWALAGYRRLLKNNQFTYCAETQELLLGYRRLNNPVTCFIQDKCTLGKEKEVAKSDLYQNYRTYCGANGYISHNKENFFRELWSAVANIRQYRAQVNGLRQYKVQGIALDADA